MRLKEDATTLSWCWLKGNTFGVQVKRAGGSAGNFHLGGRKTLVYCGLGQFKEVHEVVLPKFDKEFTETCVIEGEDVLILRFEERGTQKLFVNTDLIPKGKLRTPLMEKDWVVLCQALYQSIGGRRMVQHARFSKNAKRKELRRLDIELLD